MKKLLLCLAIIIANTAYAQLNVTFKANLPYAGNNLANIGGYVDNLGNEYALVGTSLGLSIVDVSVPASPVIKASVPGINSNWREVKVWQHYAYVTTEGCCSGLRIIDLDSIAYNIVKSKYWAGDGAISGQLSTIHALHIDNNGYIYLYGSNLFNGTAIIASLSDPWNPHYEGHLNGGTYVHDGYAYNDTLWSCHIYDGYFAVYNVANKANPVLLATQLTPGQFTHNAWLNDERTVLFTTDEVNNSYLTAYDITDLNNITELSRVQYTPGSGSIVHNTHTLNNYQVVSWYKDGIAIFDVARPDNPVLTGYYDTYTQGSGSGFNGCWGVYPYLPSGTIVASDIDNGLYVLTPDYVRGCYLEGNVTDSVSGSALNGVAVNITGQSAAARTTNILGDYKTGLAAAGLYTVTFAKAGYYVKTFTNVSLTNGVLTTLNVQLAPIVTVALSGQVIDNIGNPVPNAQVSFTGSLVTNNVVCNASGQFSISNFIPDVYEVAAGKWGYVTNCSNQNVSSGPLTIVLSEGIMDDFSFNFGWTTSGSSNNVWERAMPVATYNGTAICNPGVDVSNDCGNYALVTDNGGGGPWDNDVDFGVAASTSPLFDLTTYLDPYVNYDRWYYNGGTVNGNPDDTLKVYLSNGVTTVLLETANPSTPTNSSWVSQSFRVSNFITPTANMRFIISVRDSAPFSNIVEGGLDNFNISEAVFVKELSNEEIYLSSTPSSFIGSTELNYTIPSPLLPAVLSITDIQGRDLMKQVIQNTTGNINVGANWRAGIYIVKITSSGGNAVLKIAKRKE